MKHRFGSLLTKLGVRKNLMSGCVSFKYLKKKLVSISDTSFFRTNLNMNDNENKRMMNQFKRT